MHNMYKDIAYNDIEALDSITSAIGGELGVRMVPGGRWNYSPSTRTLVYNRSQLAGLTFQQAKGLVFYNMSHCLYSTTKMPVKAITQDVAKRVNKQCGKGAIHPNTVYQVIEAIEDERAEARLRRNRYPGLKNGDLPRVDKGYRREAFLEQYKQLQQVSPKGAVDAEGHSVYYNRVKTAIHGLVSGAMGRQHLPEDMPWSEALVKQLTDLKGAKTVDEVVKAAPNLLLDIATARAQWQGQQQQPPEEGEGGDEGETVGVGNQGSGLGQPGGQPGEYVVAGNKNQGGGQGASGTGKPLETEDGEDPEEPEEFEDIDDEGETPDSFDPDNDEDPFRDSEQGGDDEEEEPDDTLYDTEESDEPDEEEKAETEEDTDTSELDKLKEEAANNPGQSSGSNQASQSDITSAESDDGGFAIGLGGGGAGLGASPQSLNRMVPTWAAVRTTVGNIIAPLRKKIERELKDNEIVDREKGFKAGRFEGKAYMKASMSGAQTFYSRRDLAGQQSYAVMFLVDTSGSMSYWVQNAPGHFDVFANRIAPASAVVTIWKKRVSDIKTNTKRWTDAAKTRLEAAEKKLAEALEVEQKAINGELVQLPGTEASSLEGYDNLRAARLSGKGSTRLVLATRMAVALIEAMDRFREVETALGGWSSASHRDSVVHILKPFGTQKMNSAAKAAAMDWLLNGRGGGGTDILRTLQEIQPMFKKSKAQKKMAIILTDGDFYDHDGGLVKQIERLHKDGVEIVVLTLGCSSGMGARFVGEERASEIEDDTIGQVMGRHLKRMIGASRG
jgi:uncharacterized protein with von Willebrand factor type A (vWA) domain/ribosomal protein S20